MKLPIPIRRVKPRLLDLFCGAGGASVGYERAGFEVVGVDHVGQPNYPFEFIQADALEFVETLNRELQAGWGRPIGAFDAIHASPPCQAFTNARVIHGRDHPDLLTPTRELLRETGLPWVIENVAGAPLRDPQVLEGQMFEGLRTVRPRYFEVNWPLEIPPLRLSRPPQTKMGRPPRDGEYMQIVGHFSDVPAGREAMGIEWMTQGELAQAVPPAYTELIGHQLMQHIDNGAVRADTLAAPFSTPRQGGRN